MTITPEQRAAYEKLSASMVAEALEITRQTQSKVEWEDRGTVNGARAFSAQTPGSPITLVKGVVEIEIDDIDDVVREFMEAVTAEKLAAAISQVDNQFRECDVLGLVDLVPGKDGATATSKTSLEWTCFSAPPIYPRDFCWLAHQRTTQDEGRTVFLSVCNSVERDECPDYWPTRSLVRGLIRNSGYVFRATARPNVWQLSYLVQIDPKGIVPAFLANFVAKDQAGLAGRMRDVIVQRQTAKRKAA